jgi:hypothetical protein
MEAFRLQRIRFAMIVERKLRRRQITEDGDVETSGRDLREKTPPGGQGSLFARATWLSYASNCAGLWPRSRKTKWSAR